jgi:hypothetical protein
MDPTVLLQQVVNGLSIGLVYALMAIGFTLIFGVLNVVNFAHGEVYTVGAFIGLLVITALSPPLWLVLLMVLMGGGLAGYVLERVAFKPFRRFRDEASIKSKAMREATLLSSLAVSIIVREALELKFSGEMQTIAQNYLLQTPIQLGPIAITDGNLIIFGLSLVSLLALQFVLYRTRIGLAIRAVSNNVLGAQFVGIDTGRAIVATFRRRLDAGRHRRHHGRALPGCDLSAHGFRAGREGLRGDGHGRPVQHPRRGGLRTDPGRVGIGGHAVLLRRLEGAGLVLLPAADAVVLPFGHLRRQEGEDVRDSVAGLRGMADEVAPEPVAGGWAWCCCWSA